MPFSTRIAFQRPLVRMPHAVDHDRFSANGIDNLIFEYRKGRIAKPPIADLVAARVGNDAAPAIAKVFLKSLGQACLLAFYIALDLDHIVPRGQRDQEHQTHAPLSLRNCAMTSSTVKKRLSPFWART